MAIKESITKRWSIDYGKNITDNYDFYPSWVGKCVPKNYLCANLEVAKNLCTKLNKEQIEKERKEARLRALLL